MQNRKWQKSKNLHILYIHCGKIRLVGYDFCHLFNIEKYTDFNAMRSRFYDIDGQQKLCNVKSRYVVNWYILFGHHNFQYKFDI